jgi:hypothetical protein
MKRLLFYLQRLNAVHAVVFILAGIKYLEWRACLVGVLFAAYAGFAVPLMQYGLRKTESPQAK